MLSVMYVYIIVNNDGDYPSNNSDIFTVVNFLLTETKWICFWIILTYRILREICSGYYEGKDSREVIQKRPNR